MTIIQVYTQAVKERLGSAAAYFAYHPAELWPHEREVLGRALEALNATVVHHSGAIGKHTARVPQEGNRRLAEMNGDETTQAILAGGRRINFCGLPTEITVVDYLVGETQKQ